MTKTADPAMPELRPDVSAIADEMIAIRRDVHEHAELSTEERRTQALIMDRLRALGAEDVRVSAQTGVTAIIRGGKPGPNLLWRADIDGLPLVEETGLPFASPVQAMHACGHDGHVAIALGIAQVLQGARERLAGTVRFAFQPAEEHVGGAKRMVDEGVMREPKVDAVYGLHVWAPLPVGEVSVQPGPVFAAATHFRIIVRGRGGHAAAPHETVDPIVTAAHVITALQTVVSRNINADQSAVVSIGRIEGGKRGNIIPNEVMMTGTIRTYDEGVLQKILQRMGDIIAGTAAAHGAESQFDCSTLGACVNATREADLVRMVATGLLGESRVRTGRTNGADDMAYFLNEAPGAYFMLGAQPRHVERVYPHHHPKFDIDEAAIPIGIELGLRILEEASGSTL